VSKNNALGHAPVGHLLFQFSLPAIVGMTAASVYNMIDRIFIGHGVGPLAISGLALTMPFANLAIAFGAMVGVGASVLVSIRLGEKRDEDALRILGTTVMLNLVLSLGYSLAMLVLLDPILRLFGASPETLPYARQFMQVILLGNVFQHSYLGLNSIMRSAGFPRKAMLITLSTVAVNLALAPVFLFVLHWGIRGAAFATVLAQLAGLALVVHHFADRRNALRFRRENLVFDRVIIRDIFSVGMSAFFMQLCASMVAVVMNRQLVRYGGDYAVGAFGVINSVIMTVAMIIMGLTQGMQPIVGFNYGARHFVRMRRAFRLTVLAASVVALGGFALGQLLPHGIARLFTDDVRLLTIAEKGMRIAMLAFPLVGIPMVTSSFFQSIGKAKISILLSLSRQAVFLIPALVLLPHFWGFTGVWAALPVSDACATFLAVAIWKYQSARLEAPKHSGRDIVASLPGGSEAPPF